MDRLQRPSVTLNIVGSVTTASIESHRVLIIGELGTVSATATADTVIKDISASDTAQFGTDSQLKLAIEKFKDINELSTLDVLPVATGTTAPTSDLTVANDATKASTLKISIGGDFEEVSIASGDTKATIATAIETAYASSTLFTVTRASNVVTFTAKQTTKSLNNIKIFITDSLSSGCSATATDFTGGASTTLANSYLDGISIDERYQSIIFDSACGAGAVSEYLDDNFNLTNQINDGVGFTTMCESLANCKTTTDALNYKSLVVFCNINEMKFDTYSLVATAEIVAIRALRLTEDSNISQYVLGYETKGSMSMCTFPYFNTPLSFPKPSGIITEAQLIDLIGRGGSVWTYNNQTVLSEVVTTYKTDLGGNDDDSWHYLNYIDTMSVIREYFVSNLRIRYGQMRFTDGDLIQGKSITNKGAVKATLTKLYSNLASMGITRLGYNKVFSDNLTLTDDLGSGTITLNAKVPIVTQLRTISGNVIEVLDISTII